MAKSTQLQALAAVSQKLQRKIVEVGTLKNKLTKAIMTLQTTTDVLKIQNAKVDILNTRNVDLARKVAEYERGDVAKSVQNLQAALSNAKNARVTAELQLDAATKRADGLNLLLQNSRVAKQDAQQDASDWRSYSAIGTLLGLAIGVLCTIAYFHQAV